MVPAPPAIRSAPGRDESASARPERTQKRPNARVGPPSRASSCISWGGTVGLVRYGCAMRSWYQDARKLQSMEEPSAQAQPSSPTSGTNRTAPRFSAAPGRKGRKESPRHTRAARRHPRSRSRANQAAGVTPRPRQRPGASEGPPGSGRSRSCSMDDRRARFFRSLRHRMWPRWRPRAARRAAR